MDLAMRLLKAPVYDTDIPGIRFVTQGEDEADWSKDPTVYGADMGLSHIPEEDSPIADIKMITPNQFLAMTPKEGMDESSPYYQDLMDRAQAGEDVKFTMPHVDTGMSPPGHPQHEPEINFHNGRHRMQELVRRGYGDIPVPVHYTDMSTTDPSDPHFSPDVIDFPSHNRIETGEPMDLAWRLLKEEARGPSWPRPDKWGNTYADAADDATKRGRPMMTLSHAELQQIIDDTKEAWGEWLDSRKRHT